MSPSMKSKWATGWETSKETAQKEGENLNRGGGIEEKGRGVISVSGKKQRQIHCDAVQGKKSEEICAIIDLVESIDRKRTSGKTGESDDSLKNYAKGRKGGR